MGRYLSKYLRVKMDNITELFTSKQFFISAVAIIITVVIALIFLKILKKLFLKFKETSDNGIPKEKKTMMRIFYSVLRFAVWLIVIIAVLSYMGINISGAVTALGIAGACAALAVQDLLKDLIQGINIVTDKYFAIGDIIEYNSKIGKVVELSMRTTKIKLLTDQSIYTIANHNISEIRKLAGAVDINIPLSYDADREYVYKVLTKTAEKISKNPDVNQCDFLGTNSFGDSAINYLIMIYCTPDVYLTVRRKALVIIQDDLKKAGLQIPYNHLDVTMLS